MVPKDYVKYLPVPLSEETGGTAGLNDAIAFRTPSARLADGAADAIVAAMRILYHLPLSPYCRKVRLVLAEKRLPFELRVEKVWERRPEYLEMNPACTVPTLIENNGLVIPDSDAICEYLDEAYPDTTLLGRTLAERVETRRLVAWFDGKFDRRGDAQPARGERP